MNASGTIENALKITKKIMGAFNKISNSVNPEKVRFTITEGIA